MDHYFRWWFTRVIVWFVILLLSALYFSVSLSEPDIIEIIVLSMIVASAAVLITSIIRRVYLAVQRAISREQLRRRVEQTGPEIPSRGRYFPPSSRPLVLQSLRLLIESRKAGRVRRNPPTIGMLVNPRTDISIRPFADVIVNDPGLVGRQVPLTFRLVDPFRRIQFETSLTLTFLATGELRVVPRDTFRITRRLSQGAWKVQIKAGDRLWGEKEFSLTTVTLDKIASEVGSDMEMGAAAEKEAEEFAAGANPEEVLGDILE